MDKKRRITRRDFLDSLGAVAGGAAVYRAMDAMGLVARGTAQAKALPDGRGKRVAILGAGVAGLVSALELERAG